MSHKYINIWIGNISALSYKIHTSRLTLTPIEWCYFSFLFLHNRWLACTTDNEEIKYHAVRTLLKYNGEIVETEVYSITLIHLHSSSLSWHGTGTSIKSDGVKLVLWAQTSSQSEMMCHVKCFPPVVSTFVIEWFLFISIKKTLNKYIVLVSMSINTQKNNLL